MIREYANDPTIFDDRTLNPQEATRLWRVCPEGLRHGLMNMIYALDPALHDEVLRRTARTGTNAEKSA